MKVLALDPGAERMGWAVLNSQQPAEKTYLASGISGVPRQVIKEKQEPYQEYRLRLIAYWVDETLELLRYAPDLIVSEIVPVVGGGNFVAATQSQLAGTAITTAQVVATYHEKPLVQIGATTVKARIGGSKKATKPQMRNGVLKLLPQLEHRRKEWTGTHIWDEVDAIAIGLCHLGYRNR